MTVAFYLHSYHFLFSSILFLLYEYFHWWYWFDSCVAAPNPFGAAALSKGGGIAGFGGEAMVAGDFGGIDLGELMATGSVAE
jgi:hypothetical protein